MAKNDSTRTIWDVIFSLDSTYFPIQRNYPQEPRGSLNPVNSRITHEIHKKLASSIKTTLPNLYDLYALDYELNYTIRKLADLALFGDRDELTGWLNGSGFPVPENIIYGLEKFLKKWGENKCIHTLLLDLIKLALDPGFLKKGEFDIDKHPDLMRMANLQKTAQFIIENSKFDWEIKAKAFLRASSVRNYSTADDETIIYLMAQNLGDIELETEARYRWKRYKKEWEELFFAEKNPFKCKFIPDRLRFIHWDKLGTLRPLEPQLPSETRDSYDYKSESQRLLSTDFLTHFTKVFSLFRTDMDVEPIKSQLPKLIEKFHSFLSGMHDYEYNHTVSDVYYLSDILFSFVINRVRQDVLNNNDYSTFVHQVKNHGEYTPQNSSIKFTRNIPKITLVALEVYRIYYSGSKEMMPLLQEAKEWLLSQQTPYGYWYDGVNNPEYTTVLVLDALALIDGQGTLSFPRNTDRVIPSFSKKRFNH
jgi:hypothetical protein